ncbi:hypothetical protein HaLaN_24655, partial [Haematococcus lacustris]
MAQYMRRMGATDRRVEAHRGHSEAINNETSGLPGPLTPKQLPPAQ